MKYWKSCAGKKFADVKRRKCSATRLIMRIATINLLILS